MKFKIFSLTFALAAMAALSSCGDDWQPGDSSQFPTGTGGVSSGTLNVEVADEPVKATGRADDGNTIDTSSFQVYITAKGSLDVMVFNKETCRWNYGTMPEIVTLPVGDYTVHVASHDPEPVAWSAPYYEGTADFTVVNNKVVNIGTVKCLFRSLKIAVHFDEDFLEAMDPDNSTVTVTAGAEGTSTVWTSTETRCAYFRLAEANPTVIAHFNGALNGQTYTVGKTVTDARIGDYYIFRFSLNQGNPEPPEEFGSTTIPESGINIDVDMVREEYNNQLKPGEDISVSDEKHPNAEEWPDPVGPGTNPENPDDPTPPGPSDSGVKLESPAGFDVNGVNDVEASMDYVFKFTTESPIEDVIVDIDSPDYLTKPNGDSNMLKDVGLDSHFSLVNPGELDEALEGLGFPTGEEVKGKKILEFVLTDLIKLLNSDTGGRHIHKFTITIKTEGRPDYVQTLQFRNK